MQEANISISHFIQKLYLLLMGQLGLKQVGVSGFVVRVAVGVNYSRVAFC